MYICICCHASGSISRLIHCHPDSLLEDFTWDLDAGAVLTNTEWDGRWIVKRHQVLRGFTVVTAFFLCLHALKSPGLTEKVQVLLPPGSVVLVPVLSSAVGTGGCWYRCWCLPLSPCPGSPEHPKQPIGNNEKWKMTGQHSHKLRFFNIDLFLFLMCSLRTLNFWGKQSSPSSG